MSNITFKGGIGSGSGLPTGGNTTGTSTTNFISSNTGGMGIGTNKPGGGLFGGNTGMLGTTGMSSGTSGLNTGTTTTGMSTGFTSGGQGLGGIITGINMTGNKSSVGGIGGGISGGIGTFTTNQSNISGMFGLPIGTTMQTNINQPDKKQFFLAEIINVIQSYIDSLSPDKPNNVFKAMLYNRVPKGQEYQLENMQFYQDKKIGEDKEYILIDHNLWVKALQNNPLKHLFYPSQISSPIHLYRRIKTTQMFLYSALQLTMGMQNTLAALNDQYDNEIENMMSLIKLKLNIMKSLELRVTTKLERVALMTGLAETNYSLETEINSRFNNIKSVIYEKSDYTTKVKELSTMLSIMGNEPQVENEEDDYFRDFDKTRLEKNMNILADMKKIFDATFSNLRQNLSVVNTITSDLEKLKKYGKLPK